MKQRSAVSNMLTGLAAGAVVGTAAYMMSSQKKRVNKTMKKNAGKAIKAVGAVIDNVSYMMK